eukprot:scaffold704_cov131-Skeletonema_marinoi.AAC.3
MVMAVPPWPSSLEENDRDLISACCSSLLSAAARRLFATITSSWGGIEDVDFHVLYATCPVLFSSKLHLLCYFMVTTDFVIVVKRRPK